MRPRRWFYCLLLLLAWRASAQRVEAIIPLPDSIVGLKDPRCVAFADGGNRALVGGSEGWLIGISCEQDTKLGRIAVAPGVSAMLANPEGSKVYCAHARPHPGADSIVTIVDPVAMTVLGTLRVGRNPVALEWSERHERLYCANSGDGAISVICGNGDTLVAVWAVRDQPCGVVYSERFDRLYVTHRFDRWVLVLEGSTGARVDSIDVGTYPGPTVLDTAAQRLYVAYGPNLAAVDCSTNVVVGRVHIGRFIAGLAHHPATDRLFFTLNHNDAVVALDCGSLQILGHIPVGNSPREIALDPVHGMLLCSNHFGRSVTAIDPQTLQATATLQTRPQPSAVVPNPVSGLMYVVHEGNAAVSVVDAQRGELAVCYSLWEEPKQMWWVGGDRRKLLCLTEQDQVYAIDGQSLQVLYGIDAGPFTTGLVADPVGNKFYVSNYEDSSVTVYDAGDGSRLHRIKVGAYPACLGYNWLDRKVYACRQGRVQIIDAATDTIVGGLSLVGGGVQVLHNEQNNKMYFIDRNTHSVYIVDGATNGMLGMVRAGENPAVLGLNPGNQEVYCSYPSSHKVAVIGDTSNALIDTISVPGDLTCAWGGFRGEVWVGDRERDMLYVFSQASHLLVDSIGGIGDPAAILCCIYGLMYACDRENDVVFAISELQHTVEETLRVDRGPVAVLDAPEVGRLFVMCRQGGSVAVLAAAIGIRSRRQDTPSPTFRLEVRPNPCRGSARVSLNPVSAEGGKLEVLDVAGRMVSRDNIPRDGKTELDLRGLESGVYHVRVASAKGQFSERLTVLGP